MAKIAGDSWAGEGNEKANVGTVLPTIWSSWNDILFVLTPAGPFEISTAYDAAFAEQDPELIVDG